jgi:hypothetical protein
MVMFIGILPFIVLACVATARGQSMWYMLWGFLSWTGVIIGLLVMIALPQRTQQRL